MSYEKIYINSRNKKATRTVADRRSPERGVSPPVAGRLRRAAVARNDSLLELARVSRKLL
jgi:hypothetical protein